MVHFGTKVTNAVHHHWFSGGYSEKTDFRSDHIFYHNFGGEGLNRKTNPKLRPGKHQSGKSRKKGNPLLDCGLKWKKPPKSGLGPEKSY